MNIKRSRSVKRLASESIGLKMHKIINEIDVANVNMKVLDAHEISLTRANANANRNDEQIIQTPGEFRW